MLRNLHHDDGELRVRVSVVRPSRSRIERRREWRSGPPQVKSKLWYAGTLTKSLALGVVVCAVVACHGWPPPAIPQVPETTIREFISHRLAQYPAFKALVDAADLAQVAQIKTGTTKIEELDQDSDAYVELQKLVNAAKNAYRNFQTYGTGHMPSSSALSVTGVIVTDYYNPRAYAVPLGTNGALLRVAVLRQPYYPAIIVEAIESARAKTIVTFDSAMTPTIAQEFQAYLLGDSVDVTGVARRRIKRGDPERLPRTTPSPPVDRHDGPVVPADYIPLGTGCTKDVDCKGDRICVQGACVNPSR